MLPQQYCLRWRYHHSNLQTMFSQLLEREAFCDVTLACEGKTIKAHKIVLSACSTYFDTILTQYEEKDPILIMKDVKYIDIKCLVEFMYKGEINVDHCHLATLLKTAEELKIKGLAEVSWNEDEAVASTEASASNGIQSALPHVSTVMESPKSTDASKRKRGRPPIDDTEPQFTSSAAKIANVCNEEIFSSSNEAPSPENHVHWNNDDNHCDEKESGDVPQLKVKPEFRIKSEYHSADDSDGHNDLAENIIRNEMPTTTTTPVKTPYTVLNSSSMQKASSSSSSGGSMGGGGGGGQNCMPPVPSGLTAALEKEWPDVIKMNDYLNTGRRQQFWEEPFTKRVMDAIKTKNLEMKIAAELLGVSYGTLYGRYRDAYGCLKHPYRVREFWSEQGPTDILLKLKRKEITLYRAAEQLNVTPQTLSNYLISMSALDTETFSSGHVNISDTFDEVDSDEETDAILPDIPATFSSPSTSSNSVLAHCPDITIIKKEKYDSSKMNNNSDHSDRQFGKDQL